MIITKYFKIIYIKEENMANYRIRRINEEVQKEISEILREVKDPRVSRNFISITAAEVTGDLKFAKIYYSVVSPMHELKEISKGLRSATGFIRGQLARRLNLRQTPELTFVYDSSAENGAYISSLLKKVEETLPPLEDEESEE